MNHMSHHGWDVSLDPHTVPVFLWLQWAHRRSLQPMQPTLARHALSSAEFDLLATLRNAEPDKPTATTPWWRQLGAAWAALLGRGRR